MSIKNSLTDLAYDLLKEKQKPVLFDKLWAAVKKQAELKSDDSSQFFMDMMLDGRFFNDKGNKWDLKENRTFAETLVDVDEIALVEDDDYGEDSELKTDYE